MFDQNTLTVASSASKITEVYIQLDFTNNNALVTKLRAVMNNERVMTHGTSRIGARR
jgi:hypothetical protein